MYKEEFSSIFELMNTLKERPNNKYAKAIINGNAWDF